MAQTNGNRSLIIETERLIIRPARNTGADVDMYFRLWTDPRVMTNVGFPRGLKTSREEIATRIAGQSEAVFKTLLVAELKSTRQPIGECWLEAPDKDGVAGTDVKLLPEYWGHRLGTEIKQALVDYLFTNSDCEAVKATPNKNNIASQKMQEAVGGKRVGEEVHRFPEHMKDYTCDLALYVYKVFRSDWEKRRK